MKVDSTKLVNGLINFADQEVINNLPTVGKWLVGAGVGITTSKINEIVNALNENSIVKMMGIIDEDGLFDIDLIIDNLKQSANRYGKMNVQVPLVGRLTFSESDVDTLRGYIERG